MKNFIFIFFVMISCNSFSQLFVDRNLLRIENYQDQVYNDPNVDYSKYKSFSMISTNQFLKKEEQTFLEKHIEFFFSNIVNYVGLLKYIPFNDSIKPDLLFVYNYSHDYAEKYVSPQAYTIPYWNYGGRTTTTINTNASGTANVIGDVNLTGSGYVNKSSTINTQNPSEWKLMRIEKPGYTVGKYYPSFSVIIYDTSNGKKIWEGTGTGTSDNKDFRLTGQMIMVNMALKIPRGSYEDDEFTNNSGYTGLIYFSYCTDGQRYFPVVYYPIENSPATKSGFKDFDIITEINGVSTINKTHRQLELLERGPVGTKILYTIDRNGKIMKKTLTKSRIPNN